MDRNPNPMQDILTRLPTMPLALKNEMAAQGILKAVPAGTELLREGQFVQYIPLVLTGLLKVFSRHEDKELLLYYIEPAESCVMSFSAGMGHFPSKIHALAEEDTEVLLLPVSAVAQWTQQYPALNQLFFQQYNQRYEDLLHSIHQVLFDKLDKRLYDYLLEKASLTGNQTLDLRHHQIARELGTAREVVSRVLKKLEGEGKIQQLPHGIKMVD